MDDMLAGVQRLHRFIRDQFDLVMNRSLATLKFGGLARNSPEEFLSTDIERGGSNPWSSPAAP